ncbi:hypothetical protein [Microbacterium sp. A93]|uniref:hypothetical protein n=1 Tax=Microbacterium sp. A93 TaxID=3450716 RepID=UPI003F436427
MSSTAKLTATLVAFVFVATALAGCTAATPPQADPSPKPTASHAPKPNATPASAETDADACPHFRAKIHIGGMSASIRGTLVDNGARGLAAGTVGLDDEGNIVSYTVAPGDALDAIGARLCIEYAYPLAELNHTRTIHPDQVLRLNPDPEVPWVPYYNPVDAAAGFQQIPYQQAIEAMAAAGDAGDVDTMRAIWTDELSGMFTDQAVIDMIQQAIDTGDIDVLSQMFS